MDAVSNQAKILIVDDDAGVRNFLEMFFKLKGYNNISAVEKGFEAVEIVRNQDIRLVILDVMLADINGMDVLRQIKEIKEAITVIMITGYPDEEKAKEAMSQGAYDYIVKPFDLDYLELSVLSRIALAE